MSLRVVQRAALVLALLHVGCVSEPGEASRLTSEQPLEVSSETGLVQAKLELVGGPLRTGNNDFLLTLADSRGLEPVTLERVVAAMAAHGHSSTPQAIHDVDGGYRIESLELSMPGVWEVDCDVRVGKWSDLVAFTLDVP